ncbi:ATPase, P-type transporting, HAD superfamily, subfamily IC family protein [Asticcacaulis biprosthecium C19]|uniref:ATPase, P-type transporting, HAD superfamily, subfamily IC family protein n=1 Tax=Asticcacaulis biprosthecium C19 TaxID=715226 RepID=F4QH92_9CAUL|nr:cation-translocating P-type ATPase [Asticcacaulis biprosthecium]EGF92629.1 ATPase, P-type transporting, HAD superfamily, subfamily IC family protein [Asticcacaulis biprosthecium C19]
MDATSPTKPPQTRPGGLTTSEAQSRLRSEGFNELPKPDKRTPFRIVLEVLREPMLVLLLAGGVIYLVIGDLKEALVLLGFAMASVAITVVQEARTEKVLEALRDLTSPRALVLRDGQRVGIEGREVARGDVIVLSEGDRVPADAKLIESHDLQVDESLLTGESLPVRKTPSETDDGRVFSGALIVRGTAVAEVFATGVGSRIGQIGHSLKSLKPEVPRLQTETRKLVVLFAAVGGIVCLTVVLLYGLFRGGWLEAFLAGIALGMSMLPEELPVVLTVFMAMGAWRISQARVLTRKASAIETLGSATVLCTDKTGTLTENKMSVAELRLKAGEVARADAPLTQGCLDLAEFGRLASEPEPHDPMEKAFHAFAAQQGPSRIVPGKLVNSYGLRPDFLAMSQVWQPDDVHLDRIVAAKGAPEAIAELCRFSDEEVAVLKLAVEAMAGQGLRVLGIARASHTGADLPASQRDFAFEFLGLVGLADPLRASVPAAIKECRTAGIRVIMITGDYPVTAQSIARQAGLFDGGASDEVVSGDALAALDDAALTEKLKSVTVFARIQPEQKLRLVQALKANGEIVAMTGDGVNDAPSLKAAHIGIAMGGRGTDVAREASSIVLLDDDFGSIVKAVRLGRRIYDNLRKAIAFIFAVHVPIAGLALLPLVFGLPILFGPMHIAFLEMVIDPVCSLVFEAESEEDNVMNRPPRAPLEPLFSKELIAWSVLQGTLALSLVAAIFMVALHLGMAENEVRALAFVSLILSIVALIFVNRSYSASLLTALKRPNSALGYVLSGVVAMLALTLLWPWARDLFRFGPLHGSDLALSLGAGVITLICLEGLKPFWRRWLSSPRVAGGMRHVPNPLPE